MFYTRKKCRAEILRMTACRSGLSRACLWLIYTWKLTKIAILECLFQNSYFSKFCKCRQVRCYRNGCCDRKRFGNVGILKMSEDVHFHTNCGDHWNCFWFGSGHVFRNSPAYIICNGRHRKNQPNVKSIWCHRHGVMFAPLLFQT